MTKEEILGTKPGRELDAMIAHQIMKWGVAASRSHENWDYYYILILRPDIGGCEMNNKYPRYSECAQMDIPPYSTSIQAAWEVFEHNGYLGNVGYMGEEYRCELYTGFDKNGIGKTVTTTGKTAPEAICKASLLAIMEDSAHA